MIYDAPMYQPKINAIPKTSSTSSAETKMLCKFDFILTREYKMSIKLYFNF